MRPDRDTWLLRMAHLVAERGTCLRRRVGCVLVNKRGHVLATGYNGVAAGLPHCNDMAADGSYPHACIGATAASGTCLDDCQALHAEQSALMQCHDVYAIEAAFVTLSPCVTCTKLLLSTSCERIVFSEVYPQPQAQRLWETAGRQWIKL